MSDIAPTPTTGDYLAVTPTTGAHVAESPVNPAIPLTEAAPVIATPTIVTDAVPTDDTAEAIPAPEPTFEELLTLDLPGGGTATFRRPSEIPARTGRPLQIMQTFLQPKLRAAQRAARITIEGEVASDDAKLDGAKFDGADVSLSYEETDQVTRLTELGVIAYLKSWTLARPLPTTVDMLLNENMPIYNALSERVAKLMSTEDDEFSIDNIENPDSPTGGSSI